MWIKDIVDENVYIINASKINENLLIDAFITKFDSDYNVIQNIKTKKIDIKKNDWIIYDPIIFQGNDKNKLNKINLYSNFNYEFNPEVKTFLVPSTFPRELTIAWLAACKS